ncbi:MAG: GIY-YIG nuclease family protein [Synergistaceae bacterium]
MRKIWYVYMVRCKNGSLYTGITNDLERRISKHNSKKGSKAVIMMGVPVVLAYQEEMASKSKALKRECEIKQLKKEEKEELVKQ